VRLDHIVGECVIVDFVGHDHHLVECRAQRREKGGRGPWPSAYSSASLL
jgi:hypothetical protein